MTNHRSHPTTRCGLLPIGLAVALAACSGSGDKPAAETNSSAAPAATSGTTAATTPAATAAPNAAPATQTMPSTPPATSGDAVTTPSGLKYVITKHGTGPLPHAGQTVAVQYVGTLPDGKQFDASPAGKPYEFVLGKHLVIEGWEQGIALLHVGDRATFTIPPSLGYGPGGSPPVIPGNATLIFEVELMGAR